MLVAVLCGVVALTGHAHAQQTATATGPCGNAINASEHATVNVDVNCILSDGEIARNLIRNSEKKQWKRDREQDLTTTEILARIDDLQMDVDLLTSVVTTIRENAQSPDADVVWKRAFEKLQQGDSQAAAALLGDEADAAARSSAYQRDFAIKLYQQQGDILAITDPTQALRVLKKALHLTPDDTTILRKAGHASMMIGNYQDAARYLDQRNSIFLDAVKADPSNFSHHYEVGVSHSDLGDLQVHLAASRIESGDLKQGRVHIRSAEQHYTEALSVFERLVKSGCCDAEWIIDLAGVHQRLGRLKLDVGDFIAAEKSYKVALDVLGGISEVQSGSTRWQEAVNAMRVNFADILEHRDDLTGAQKYYEEALTGFEQLVARESTNVDWHFYEAVIRYKLGRVYILTGDQGGGLAQLRVALDILRSLKFAREHLVGHRFLRVVERAVSALDADERKP
jgi:tetratricopeptide (TPR) repeat protein